MARQESALKKHTDATVGTRLLTAFRCADLQLREGYFDSTWALCPGKRLLA